MRDRLSKAGDQLAAQQAIKFKLMLAAIPGAVLFLVAGAAPMVGLVAGLATGLLAFGPRLMPTELRKESGRGFVLAGGAFLILAAGLQTVVWRLNLTDQAVMALLLAGGGGILLVFILTEVVRWIWKRVLQ
jgi:hypothetical protein